MCPRGHAPQRTMRSCRSVRRLPDDNGAKSAAPPKRGRHRDDGTRKPSRSAQVTSSLSLIELDREFSGLVSLRARTWKMKKSRETDEEIASAPSRAMSRMMLNILRASTGLVLAGARTDRQARQQSCCGGCRSEASKDFSVERPEGSPDPLPDPFRYMVDAASSRGCLSDLRHPRGPPPSTPGSKLMRSAGDVGSDRLSSC
jgi:hypothetical protein